MHLFHQPSESQVRRLLNDAKLPTADLTPEHLKRFIGCGLEEAPKGVVGLEIYGPDALLRSLTVEEKTRGQGCGKALVAEAERYAKGQGVRRIYLLTTNAAKFFDNLGYSVVPRADAPECVRKTPEFSSLCPSSSTFMAKDLTAV
jgi:amino-acid N-acetyltransferase